MGRAGVLRRAACGFVLVIAVAFEWCHGRVFSVGNRDGWVIEPSEPFNHWAERNRFLVNDILHFKYNKMEDSVLVVTREDYNSCITENPIIKMDGGDDSFKLDRSGPFYFVSGVKAHCQQGQRIIVTVLSDHRHLSSPFITPPPPTIPAPRPQPTFLPSASPPSLSPVHGNLSSLPTLGPPPLPPPIAASPSSVQGKAASPPLFSLPPAAPKPTAFTPGSSPAFAPATSHEQTPTVSSGPSPPPLSAAASPFAGQGIAMSPSPSPSSVHGKAAPPSPLGSPLANGVVPAKSAAGGGGESEWMIVGVRVAVGLMVMLYWIN